MDYYYYFKCLKSQQKIILKDGFLFCVIVNNNGWLHIHTLKDLRIINQFLNIKLTAEFK